MEDNSSVWIVEIATYRDGKTTWHPRNGSNFSSKDRARSHAEWLNLHQHALYRVREYKPVEEE